MSVKRNTGGLTEDEDIEDQDNETNDSTTGSILPCITVAGGREGLVDDGGGVGEGSQAELEEDGNVLQHDGY